MDRTGLSWTGRTGMGIWAGRDRTGSDQIRWTGWTGNRPLRRNRIARFSTENRKGWTRPDRILLLGRFWTGLEEPEFMLGPDRTVRDKVVLLFGPDRTRPGSPKNGPGPDRRFWTGTSMCWFLVLSLQGLSPFTTVGWSVGQRDRT